jgi:hypothetical protein
MRKIVVINAELSDAGAYVSVSVVLRLVAPANMRRLLPTATSTVPDSTTEETAALRTGEIVEKASSISTSSTSSVPVIEAAMEADYATKQSALDDLAFSVNLMGAYWDGTSWVTP